MRLRGLLLSRKVLLALVCHCLILCAFGQVTIGKVITDRRLEWSDFVGTADAGSPYSALTNWTISLRAHVDSFRFDTVFLSFRITPVFNAYASWVKKEKIKKRKESEALLRHEQGHYDLAMICAQALKQALQTTVFCKSTYAASADSIADATITLFTDMEDRYDLETSHMLNRTEQKRWSQNITNLLGKTPNAYHSR